MGEVIEAGLSAWRGDSAAAMHHLLLADRAFDAADMQPTAREGVVDLARVVAALAP